MALLWAATNSVKGVWSAIAFNYLQISKITTARQAPGNSIEAICYAFDQNFWESASANAAPGTLMAGPMMPTGLASWGLQTVWRYWIDNHLAKIESNVGPWLTTGKINLQALTTGSSQLASKFIAAFMGGSGLANANQMHFPRAVNFASTPLPGTAGSAITTNSRYGMWGNNGLGALGI